MLFILLSCSLGASVHWAQVYTGNYRPMASSSMLVQDAKVVDHACTALSRIAESYARHPDRLDMLCNHGLITSAVQLVCIPPDVSS